MSVDDRALKFREAVLIFIIKHLPKILPEVQPAVADMAWLIVNHFFSQEESKELFGKFQKIWELRSVESNYQIELLAYCAWKIRLYLTFDQPEKAFRLFQQITKILLYKGIALDAELEACCLPISKNFPFPKIPEKDILLLFGVSEAVKQTKGNLTLRMIMKQTKYGFEELIQRLQNFEMNFGCLVAFEALGLYWLRAEVEINSQNNLQPLIERFKPYVYHCEFHSPLKRSYEPCEDGFKRFSFEFAYPIAQKNTLFEWARKNQVQLFRKVNERIYQNFNVLYKEGWTPKDTTIVKPGSQITVDYNLNEIQLTKLVLQIIDVYQKVIFFSKGVEVDEVNCLLPIHRIGSELKTGVILARQETTKLFQQRILIPYFFSNLLVEPPEKIVEGTEFSLSDEAESFLYTRTETLQRCNEEKKGWEEKIVRMYTPEVSPKLIKMSGFRTLQRVYWEVPVSYVRVDRYDLEKSCWRFPKLPHIHDLLN
ncbi:MAG: hypothetical protein ACFFCQ_17165 [Promethearchaeota archaeon]